MTELKNRSKEKTKIDGVIFLSRLAYLVLKRE